MINNIEKQFMEGFFNQKDSDLSVKEFEVALKSLMAAGIIREVEVSGETMYQLTELGKIVAQHRFDTIPKNQN